MKMKVLVTYREPKPETMKKFGTEIWPIDSEGMNEGIKKVIKGLDMEPILVKPFGYNTEPVNDDDQTNYAGENLYKYFSEEDIRYAKELCRNSDGLVLPGGLMTTLNEQLLVRVFQEANKPILGICAGQNVVNKALGGTIVQVDNPEVHNNENTHEAHKIIVNNIIEDDNFNRKAFRREFPVNSIHQTIIGETAPGLKILYKDEFGNPEIVVAIEQKEIELLEIKYYKKYIFTSRMHPESAVFYKNRRGINELFSFRIFNTFKEACQDTFYNYIESFIGDDKSVLQNVEKDNISTYIELLRALYFSGLPRDEFFDRRLEWVRDRRDIIFNSNCDIEKLDGLILDLRISKYTEDIEICIMKLFNEISFNKYCINQGWFDRTENSKTMTESESMKLYRELLRVFAYSNDLSSEQRKERMKFIADKGGCFKDFVSITSVGQNVEKDLYSKIDKAYESKYKEERLDMLQQISSIVEFECYFHDLISKSKFTGEDINDLDKCIKRRDLYHELLAKIWFSECLDDVEKKGYLSYINAIREKFLDLDSSCFFHVESVGVDGCREKRRDQIRELMELIGYTTTPDFIK